MLQAFAGRRALVCYRASFGDAEAFLGVREALVADGYRRVHVAGEQRDLDAVRPSDVLPEPAKPSKRAKKVVAERPGIEVIVDRLSISEADQSRLVEAIEQAMRRGGGRVSVLDSSLARPSARIDERGERLTFTKGLSCLRCGESYPEPSPGMFSFNSPVGACDACRGFGRVIGIDWDKVLDRDKTLAGGAILAWRGKTHGVGAQGARAQRQEGARAAWTCRSRS